MGRNDTGGEAGIFRRGLLPLLAVISWATVAMAGESARRPPTNENPCDEHTVARVDAHGKEFYFCVFEKPGRITEAVFEYGSSDSVVESFGCAADLFAHLTDRPVPPELTRSCTADRRGSPVLLREPASAAGAGYCGNGAATRFAHEACWETWHNYSLPSWGFPLEERCTDSPEDDLDWQCYDHDVDQGGPYAGIGYCRPYGHTWHQRTARAQLQSAAPIRLGREVVASCSGTTVFEAYYKLNSSDHWHQALDFTMYHGGVGVWHFFNPPDDYYDLRFKATSYSGFHRYTGGFRTF